MCYDIVLLKKHCHKRLTSLDRFTFRGYHIAIFHIVSSRFLYSFDVIQAILLNIRSCNRGT